MLNEVLYRILLSALIQLFHIKFSKLKLLKHKDICSNTYIVTIMFFSAKCTFLTLFSLNIEEFSLYFIHRGIYFFVTGHDVGNGYCYGIFNIPTKVLTTRKVSFWVI